MEEGLEEVGAEKWGKYSQGAHNGDVEEVGYKRRVGADTEVKNLNLSMVPLWLGDQM